MKIKSIRYVGNEDVYDVIGSNTSNFILENGTVVHNSTMDEINDMAFVEKSKKATMKQYYSAAEEAHREIKERINSRFPYQTHWRMNKITGLITCIGQARYPTSFSEKMIQRAVEDNGIFVVRKPRWKIQPETNFSKEIFYFDNTNRRVIDEIPLIENKVCICGNEISSKGFMGYNNKVVCSIECYKKSFGVINVDIIDPPVDFYNDFKNFPDDSMRDIEGIPTASIKPLFEETNNFFSCMKPEIINPFDERYVSLIENFEPKYNVTYYMHLDGAEGGDGYGICMCHLHGWTNELIPLPIIEIDFLGQPNRATYGSDFNVDLIDNLIRILVDRKFNIVLCTYDRATDIRQIKNVLEPEGTTVAPMSIDQCANYPIIDYSKPEPPFVSFINTKGEYDKPMLDFKNITKRAGLIVPYIKEWYDIPFVFEHNGAKKKVVKIPGSQDNLGQAVAGAVFNCLNNEKDQSVGRTIEKKTEGKWYIKHQLDTFEKFLDQSQINIEPVAKDNNKNFDREPLDWEVEDGDTYYDDLNNKFRF